MYILFADDMKISLKEIRYENVVSLWALINTDKCSGIIKGRKCLA
jgi:hypothetical protein